MDIKLLVGVGVVAIPLLTESQNIRQHEESQSKDEDDSTFPQAVKTYNVYNKQNSEIVQQKFLDERFSQGKGCNEYHSGLKARQIGTIGRKSYGQQ